MGTINVNIRLRPIRFAFLVRPNDKIRTLEIFRINTCLWGGKFNPIIPYFKKVPLWWERKGYRFDNAHQILNGYLDFFEPDFIVEAEKGLADGLGFDSKRILQLVDLLDRNRDELGKCGLSVFDLYVDLYKKKYQFVRRREHDIIHVKVDDPLYVNMAACIFGGFPNHDQLKYFEETFCDVFEPVSKNINADTLCELYNSGFTSALKVGLAKLEVRFHEHQGPTLFIMDAKEPRDLIDFWNLRAVHRSIVAVPIQWAKELSSFCKSFIRDNYRPLPGNQHGVMIQPISIFSRSISEDQIKETYRDHIQVDIKEANCIQTWYPPIWQETPDFVARTMRPTIEAESKRIDIPMDEDKPAIQFETLYPSFISEDEIYPRWANIVRLQDWSFQNRIATIFPYNYKNPSFPNIHIGDEFLLSTTEGLVLFPKWRDFPQQWNLLDGTTAINTWLNKNNITAALSDAGKTTQQMVHSLGGFWGVRALANKGVIELLNEMTRKPVAKSVHFSEFDNKIHKAIGNDKNRKRCFETLVENKVVELGLELKCSYCDSWSWYSVRQLDYSLTCDLCLKSFDFHVPDPKKNKRLRWAYRVIGPFALPNYAVGAYAASLSIRFFADVIVEMHRSNVTWSSGQDLVLPSGNKLETDFILWNQRKQIYGLDYPTEIVFGEAKSFGKEIFVREDIDRMKLLAQTFPGSILVFATLKEANELSVEEIKRIKRLAEWGRSYDKERKKSRAPVIMLTGTELFTPFYLSSTWEMKGGKHEQLIKSTYINHRLDNLRILADATQQLYLDMPSYSEWRKNK